MLSLRSLRLRGGRATVAPSTPAVAAAADRPGFEIVGTREVRSSLELRRDRSSSLLVTLFGVMTVVIMAGLWFGSFSKQESMRGYVSATTGSVRVTTDFAGVVSKLKVQQGDQVVKGQPLFSMRQEQVVTIDGATTESRLATLRDQRANLVREVERLTALIATDPNDRAAFETDFDTLEASLASQEKAIASALSEQSALVERLKRLVADGYATRANLMSQQQAAIEYGRQLSEVRMRRTELTTNRIDRRRSLDTGATEATNRRATLENQMRDIDAEIHLVSGYGEIDIVAPADGRVATLAAREGSTIARGQFVAALADPEAPIRIILEAPARTTGLIAIGDRVVLKYDAFPFKTFGIKYGTVAAISDAALSLPTSFQTVDPRRPAESTFLIEVIPETATIEAYGETRPILIGSTVTADVVVERRRLIEWILDPVLAMRGRL